MAQLRPEGSIEQRRWLVASVCLHSVVIPPLRGLIAFRVNQYYISLTSNENSINTQTYPRQLKMIPNGWKDLNYRSINGNKGCEDEKEFDYKVKDAVSLAKLFMEPHMAKFDAFDDSFDASAALAVLCTPDLFQRSVNESAKDLNSEVRNECGHPDFTIWTGDHYNKCFGCLRDMVEQISKYFPAWIDKPSIEKRLKWWQEHGTDFFLGNQFDQDLIYECLREMKAFSQSLPNFREMLSEEVRRQITGSLKVFESTFNSEVDLLVTRHDQLEKDLEQEIKMRKDGDEKLRKKVEKVSSATTSLAESVKKLAQTEEKRRKPEEQISQYLESVKREAVKKVEEKLNQFSERFESLEEQFKALRMENNEKTKALQMEHKEKIKLESENERLKTTVLELQVKLKALETGDAATYFKESETKDVPSDV